MPAQVIQVGHRFSNGEDDVLWIQSQWEDFIGEFLGRHQSDAGIQKLVQPVVMVVLQRIEACVQAFEGHVVRGENVDTVRYNSELFDSARNSSSGLALGSLISTPMMGVIFDSVGHLSGRHGSSIIDEEFRGAISRFNRDMHDASALYFLCFGHDGDDFLACGGRQCVCHCSRLIQHI